VSGSRAEPRHVVVDLVEAASGLGEEGRDELLARRMMDEGRLERSEYRGVRVDREVVLGALGLVRGERLFEHFAREVRERSDAGDGCRTKRSPW